MRALVIVQRWWERVLAPAAPDARLAQRFAVWRVVFGCWCAWWTVQLAPFAVELYSRDGMVPATLIAERSILPLWLLELDAPWMVQTLLAACFVLSLLYAVGAQRPLVSCLLFLAQLWCFNRNPETTTPESTYAQWLLLASILIPSGEALRLGDVDPRWSIPKPIRAGAWLALAAGLAYSAKGKLSIDEPAWTNGTAFYYMLNFNPSRMNWYGSFFARAPIALFVPLTWIAVAAEALGPLLILHRKTRTVWLLTVMAMFAALLPFFNLTQVLTGMLVFQGFLLVLAWDDARALLQSAARLAGHVWPTRERAR